MSDKKEKIVSAEELEDFRKLLFEASEISVEAVNYINGLRYFTRKGITCKRSTETLRKKFYAKYPAAIKYTETEANKEADNIVAEALEAAQKREDAKKKPAAPAETENTNSENE